MEKTEIDAPAAVEEVVMKNKGDDSSAEKSDQGNGRKVDTKSKDRKRDVDTSDSVKNVGSSEGAGTGENPTLSRNLDEGLAAKKPGVKHDEENGIESIESQTDKTGETELNLDWNKEPVLDDAGRNKMFEEGLKLDKDGKKLEALKCYLRCLVGLKENSRFALLPQCLRNIGDIYYGRDEFDKAISFIQAEKLYYESVLIDDTELQKHIDEVTKQGVSDKADTDIDALRAAEYEQLAKLCMEEKQPQLALEYAGKCTKLRQKVFGDNHPLVQQSLDYFATVYAEVGKVKYTESMSRYKEAGEPDISSPTVAWETPDSPSEPTSILRRRKNTESDREKKVRFDETQVPSEDRNEQEEKCARFMLLIFFFLLLFVLIILGVYLLCNYESPSTCRKIRYMFSDIVMQVKYWYYRFWSNSNSKYT